MIEIVEFLHSVNQSPNHAFEALEGVLSIMLTHLFIFCRLLPPPAMWAQRKNLVSLTINVEDCKEPTITLEPTKVYFKGTGGPDKKTFEVSIDLFGEINTEVYRESFCPNDFVNC